MSFVKGGREMGGDWGVFVVGFFFLLTDMAVIVLSVFFSRLSVIQFRQIGTHKGLGVFLPPCFSL